MVVIGKLTRDPDVKYTNTGKMVANSILETSEENVNLVAWEENAKKLDSFKKGDFLKLDGYMKNNSFTRKTEFIIKEFYK